VHLWGLASILEIDYSGVTTALYCPTDVIERDYFSSFTNTIKSKYIPSTFRVSWSSIHQFGIITANFYPIMKMRLFYN
jgi:hypothetical protein